MRLRPRPAKAAHAPAGGASPSPRRNAAVRSGDRSGQKSLRDDGHVVPGVEDRWGMGTSRVCAAEACQGPPGGFHKVGLA